MSMIWPAMLHCVKYRNFTSFPGVEIYGKAQFPQSFGQISRNSAETVPFYKISTRNKGKERREISRYMVAKKRLVK